MAPAAIEYLQAVADSFGSALKRKRAEEALANSEHLKASILSSLSSQIAVVDRTGRIIASNDRWQAFTREHGRRPDWISDERTDFVVCRGAEDPRQDTTAVWEGIQRVSKGGSDSFEMEYECPSQDGERRWFLMTVTALRSPGGGAVISHHDITESKQNEQAIRELTGKLITAQEQERSRIARELHDDINQQLALLAIDLQEVGKGVFDSAVRPQLHELWKKTNEISMDVQRLSHQLHSAKLEHLGLISALRGLCQEFSKQQKIGIDFQARDVPTSLNGDIPLSLFRIAQECLRNVAKHSQARNVCVELVGERDEIVLRISDDGIGFDPTGQATRKGLGMISMKERLRLVGGELSVRPRPGNGAQVEARVPLPERNAANRRLARAQAGR